MKSLFEGIREEARKFPHLALTTTFFAAACLWWLLKKKTATTRIVEVRNEQIAIEKEYTKAMREAVNMQESERKKLTEHYREEIRKLVETDHKIDEAVRRGPVGIASEWAEYLGARK
tara:strand:+ start:481 stop:831 length:351 start_codon:yes stop_codon:yes gene_type:complete